MGILDKPGYVFYPSILHRGSFTARKSWHMSYITQLRDMYNIVIDIIELRYDKQVDCSNKLFNLFSILIYKSSSKYISNYI